MSGEGDRSIMTKDAQLQRQIRDALDASDLSSAHKRGILNGLAADLKQQERQIPSIETWRLNRKPLLKPGAAKKGREK